MSHSLEGRHALVTGSSRGIGAVIAQFFAAEGAAIAVHGRDQRAIDIVRERIEATGVKVIGVRAELTDFDEVERMRVQVEEALGPVDLLVACAGALAGAH